MKYSISPGIYDKIINEEVMKLRPKTHEWFIQMCNKCIKAECLFTNCIKR